MPPTDRCELCRGVGLVLEPVRGGAVEVIDCPEPTCPHRDDKPGLVLPAGKVERLMVRNSDVLVLRMPKDLAKLTARPEFLEHLTDELHRLEERTGWSVNVLLVDHGWQLEHADVDAMRRHGWVRAD